MPVEELLPLRDRCLNKEIHAEKIEILVFDAFQKALKRAAPELAKDIGKQLQADTERFATMSKSVKGVGAQHECE